MKKLLIVITSLMFFTTTLFSTELIQGGGNDNGALNKSAWSHFGNTYGSLDRTYNGNTFIYASPKDIGSGMYQAMTTEIGKEYEVKAILIGSDTNRELPFNGESYLTIGDATPTQTKANVFAESEHISGGTETEVSFIFTAQSTTTYLSLRSDAQWHYASARALSVKKVGDDPTPPSTDDVNSISGPATIKHGESVTLYVDYEASEERDLVAYLKTTTGEKKLYYYKRVRVYTGDKIKQFTLTVPANAPTDASYKYGTYIAPVGKYFKDNLGKAYQQNVHLESGSVAADNVNSISGPATIKHGESVTLNVDYVASQERDVVAYLKRTTGENKNRIYYHPRVTVQAGSATQQFTFTVPANAPTNETYKYGTYIAPVGGKFGDNLGKAYQQNVHVESADSDNDLPDFVKPAVSIEPYSYGDKLMRVIQQSLNGVGVHYLEYVYGAPQGLTPEETKIWQSIGNRPVDNKLFNPNHVSIYNSLTDNETTAWSKRDRGDLITYDLKVSEKVNRMELLSNYTNIYSIHGLEWHVKYENMKITEEYLDNVDMLTMMQIKQNTHKYQPLFMIRYGVRNFNTITRKKNKDLSVVFCTSIDSCTLASASFPLASGDDFKKIALSGATFYMGFKIREATEPLQYNLYQRFEETGLYSEYTNEYQQSHRAFPNWNEPSELEVDVYIYCPELDILITKTLQMPPIYNDWERRTYVTGGLYTDFKNNHLRDVSVNITGTNLVFDESAVNR